MKRIHFNVFAAAVGATGHYVTPKQFARMAPMLTSGGFYNGDDMVMYCYPKRLRSQDAHEAAHIAYLDWLDAGRPSVTSIREDAR
jgi:hypothetical protein